MVLSIIDAINIEKAGLSTLGALRYYFAGVTIIYAAARGLGVLNGAITLILLFWAVDSFVQLLLGQDLFGFEYFPGRINGPFGSFDNLKLGIALGVFFPLAVSWSEQRLHRVWLLIITTLLFTTVIISGKRSAWLVVALELAMLLGYFLYAKRIRARSLVFLVAGIVFAGAVVFQSNEGLQQRGTAVIRALTNWNYETVDFALSKRLPIWETSIEVFKANWFNGVGPRNFRFAYADYAAENDIWAELQGDDGGARVNHSHHLYMELLCETGIIGFIFFLFLCAILLARWLSLTKRQQLSALPYIVALAALLFPLNSHQAIYSSWFAQLIWLLIALLFAATRDASDDS